MSNSKQFSKIQAMSTTSNLELAADKIETMDVRIYDNGGKTADRYTAVYMDEPERQKGLYACVGMDDRPFSPQGFGQHGVAMPGAHLGKRIDFADLPKDCQRLVRQDLFGHVNSMQVEAAKSRSLRAARVVGSSSEKPQTRIAKSRSI